MQYKCVPAPLGLVITGKKDYERAVRSFANIINRESIDGWKYHSMESISVQHQPGCIAALFGAKPTVESYNMLIFSNENIEKITNQKIDYVVIENVNLRSKPNFNSSIILELTEGMNLTLLEKGEIIKYDNIEAPWVKVQTEYDETG